MLWEWRTTVADEPFLTGEFPRALDERFRLSLPAEWLAALGTECLLTKERPGCLSLWNAVRGTAPLEAGLTLLRAKLQAGRLQDQPGAVQQLGRLLSARQRVVTLAGRGRLVIPEGFREFLRVEAGGDVMLVGAGLCVEIWRPAAWLRYLERHVARFSRLLTQLTR